MGRQGLAALALSVTIATVSCSDQLRPELSIFTDSKAYIVSQPGGGPFVGVVIRNEASHAVRLALCGGTDLIPLRQRLQNGEWIDDPLAQCGASFRPKELPSGETLTLGFWNF